MTSSGVKVAVEVAREYERQEAKRKGARVFNLMLWGLAGLGLLSLLAQ